MEFITKSPAETQRLGEKIGSSLISGQNPDFLGKRIFALSGNLGSGKTTFVQGFAKGLGITNQINSPTFILVRTYRLKQKKYKTFYHVDLYRLEKDIKLEITNLGLFDIWEDENSIIVIEWAEKAKEFLPADTVWIEFESRKDDVRKILIK